MLKLSKYTLLVVAPKEVAANSACPKVRYGVNSSSPFPKRILQMFCISPLEPAPNITS